MREGDEEEMRWAILPFLMSFHFVFLILFYFV
uniref:Transmembrane protein n=1 Tax=Arundo donax TaxID=35708 RepID=A0A0A9EUX8_ARUDO